MSLERLEVLVEEPSMEEFLRILLPRLLGSITFRVYPYQCKQELLARLPDRLRGYASWLPQNWRIMVLVDRDDEDCHNLKESLEKTCKEVSLSTRSSSGGREYSVINRVVVEELESWYFGDWKAVREAYPRVPKAIPHKAKYRNPESIAGGTWEAFERILRKAGYFRNGLAKIEAARAIAPHIVPERNKAESFRLFYSTLLDMASL